MAWIETIDEDAAGEELRRLYDEARDPATGRVDHILSIHSLSPRGLAAHLALYRSAMRGSRGLPKVDREMIAVVVSGLNGCHY
jgi:alkylhydroperoxidase family enzyme